MTAPPGSSAAPEDRRVPIVRRILEPESAALRRLRLRALRSEPAAFGSTYQGDVGRPDQHWVDLARRGAVAADESIWVASLPDGVFVGMVGAFPDHGDLYVWGMWVDPAHRGSGLGGRLIDVLLAWSATAQPATRVRLTVNPAQSVAARLYERRGFERTGREEPVWHSPGLLVHEMVRAPRDGLVGGAAPIDGRGKALDDGRGRGDGR